MRRRQPGGGCRCNGYQQRFDEERKREPAAVATAQMDRQSAAQPRTDEETGEGYRRWGHREALRAGKGEAEHHDVAGLQPCEDTTEAEIADGIDDAGRERQHDDDERKRCARRLRRSSPTRPHIVGVVVSGDRSPERSGGVA
jgi:hypothetical protein